MKMRLFLLSAATTLLLPGCKNGPGYDATGIFEATTVTVSAETSGKILSIGIEEGDSIAEGETIAVIDTTLLVLRQKQLNSQRQSAESSSPDIADQAAALRSQIAHQQKECDRFARLLADGATTRKQYDEAQAMLTTLRGQLTALLSTLGKNKSSISDNAAAIHYQAEQIVAEIAKSTVTSPLEGTVLIKYAEPGEYATPGKPLAKIADLHKIYLRSYFTASQLAHIRIGQEVTVVADFGGDEQYEYPGTITWIAEESEFTPKSIQTKDSRAILVYAVNVDVKND